MAKLTVNIGASANDRTGDNLRTAFNKINTNFTELYTALGLDTDTTLNLGAFEFTGSVMTTTDSSAITIDQAVTVSSDLTVGGDVVPNTDLGGNLGSPTKRFKDLYLSGNTITLGNETISSDTGKIVLSGAVEATSLTVTTLAGGNTTEWDTAYGWGDHSVAGYIINASVTPGETYVRQVDGPLKIENSHPANPGANVGSDLEIISLNNAIAIRGESYVSVTSGPTGGPYADLDLYGGPITLHGAVLLGSGTTVEFSGGESFQLPVYADAAARDAAITSPGGGMLVYITDTGKFTGYNDQTTTWDNLN